MQNENGTQSMSRKMAARMTSLGHALGGVIDARFVGPGAAGAAHQPDAVVVIQGFRRRCDLLLGFIVQSVD